MNLHATASYATSTQPSPGRVRLAALGLVLLIVGAVLPSRLHAAKQLYTCSMHPEIIREEPGDCPVCGMKLTPMRVATQGAHEGKRLKFYRSTMNPSEVSDHPGKDSMGMDMIPVYEEAAPSTPTVFVSPQVTQEMNIKSESVTRGPAIRTIRTVGVVAYDERGLRVVTTRFDGWIDRLLVDSTWSSVTKGQVLFEVYSPDVYNAELNYLVALKTDSDANGPLVQAATQRLRLLGVSDDFIAAIARAGKPSRDYPVISPFSGVVTDKMVVEGQMIRAGEPLFRLADLSKVWVDAQLYEEDLAGLSAGQNVDVRLTYGGDQVFHGTIEQILPQVQAESRTVTARIVLPNPDARLRPGMFADVRLAVEQSPTALLVSDSAVLRSGEETLAFVALPGGAFEPRQLVLGGRVDGGKDIVLSGLKEGERVVTSGEFMIDSESRLQEAIQKMLKAMPATTPEKPDAKNRR